MPPRFRNGFHTFSFESGLTRFGLDDVRAAMEDEDSSAAPFFSKVD
jgi:hypothetical protein